MAGIAAAANPPIVVNTTGDISAPDRTITLREAIILAQGRPGPDQIIFAKGITSALLSSVLTISDREGLTINGDGDNDGQADFYFMQSGDNPHLLVRAGARLTVRGVDFILGSGAGKLGRPGGAGAVGALGKSGTNYPPYTAAGANAGKPGGSGLPGMPGKDGGAGLEGDPGAGSITNYGTLQLIRVGFGDNASVGGWGGLGGAGGKGGNGGNGGHGARGQSTLSEFGDTGGTAPDAGAGGHGAAGADGGRGGLGGKGGDAAGAIFNGKGATLTLTDVAFGGRLAAGQVRDGNLGLGGTGGKGGRGGDGGHGGPGGNGGYGGIAELIKDYKLVPRLMYSFETDVWNPDTGTYEKRTYDYCWDEHPPPGWNPFTWFRDCGKPVLTRPAPGGNGANGAKGGVTPPSGPGGDAAGGVLNLGSLSGAAALTDTNRGQGGPSDAPWAGTAAGGDAGKAGKGGFHPAGIYYWSPSIHAISFKEDIPPAPNGSDGLAGMAGTPGRKSGTGRAAAGILNKLPGVSEVRRGEGLVYVHDLGIGTDGNGKPVLSFHVLRIGEVSGVATVRWRVLRAGAGSTVQPADFVAGTLPTGLVRLDRLAAGTPFDRAKNAVRVDVPLKNSAFQTPAKGYSVTVEVVNAIAPKPILGTAEIKAFIR